MSNTMSNFIGLSVVLTGFEQSVIAPTLDPIDIKSAYLKEWVGQINDEIKQKGLPDRVLSSFEILLSEKKSNEEIGETLLSDADDDFVMACRKLIYLWYMGAWPTVVPDTNADSNTGGSTFSTTLSADSYTSGLVWKVMQAHPMGDSNYRYGYWAEPPAALNDYTGHNQE